MIIIYRDDNANCIFIEGSNGAQFSNSLQAVLNENDTTKLSIMDIAKQIEIVSNEPYTEFLDKNQQLYGSDGPSTVNALNSSFISTGTSSTEIPTITSPLTITLTQGETLNYELVADYGVGYEWDLSAVSGIVTVDGNTRKIIGGSSLGAGTYNIPVKAINYNGEDSKTIVLTVSTPPFSNTKSVQFNNLDYLSGDASILSSTLGRTGSGGGASDAWTLSFWFKPSNSTATQTILFFGGDDNDNESHIHLSYVGANNSKLLKLEYGSTNNNLTFRTPVDSLTVNIWHHVMVSYDGGTTGSSSGELNDYYGRFKIYIDSILQTTTNQHSNFGTTTSLLSELFYIGKKGTGALHMKNSCKVDELSVWDSDQSSNVSSIYNSGSPHDLNLLASQPIHWWRLGDGDSYPILQDGGSGVSCNLVMNNMTIADIINDVP